MDTSAQQPGGPARPTPPAAAPAGDADGRYAAAAAPAVAPAAAPRHAASLSAQVLAAQAAAAPAAPPAPPAPARAPAPGVAGVAPGEGRWLIPPPPVPGEGAARPPAPVTVAGVGTHDAAAGTDYARATTEDRVREEDFSLLEVLDAVIERGASDAHLTAGSPPMLRIQGSLVPLEGFDKIAPDVLQRVLYAGLTQSQRERFETDLELDFAYAVPNRARFRVNVYKQRDAVGAAFRIIPFEIKSLEELGIPPVVGNFAMLPRGFVLVTGPTGSGKSTTLAALVDLSNRNRREHIMTVEDPIEFLHQHKNCLVNQREVGADTHSFGEALKHVLRQDPDIILVGEMRDLETISVALTAAETGHLVFATLHTQDAAQTVDRVIDVFPPHQQQQIRQQLAGALQAVVCQALCKTADGRSRVAATEVMTATPAIRNLIREGKTHQIYSAMQSGAQHGMHTMDQHLAELVRTQRITYATGLEKCHHLEDFKRLCGRM